LISWVGFSNVDYAIIGARLGALQTGLYFRAYTLAVEYQGKLSIVMGQVGFPVLARTRDAAELAHLHRQMVRLLTIVTFPLLVLLAIGAPVLVPFLFWSCWVGEVVLVQILALGGASTLPGARCELHLPAGNVCRMCEPDSMELRRQGGGTPAV